MKIELDAHNNLRATVTAKGKDENGNEIDVFTTYSMDAEQAAKHYGMFSAHMKAAQKKKFQG